MIIAAFILAALAFLGLAIVAVVWARSFADDWRERKANGDPVGDSE